MKLLFETYAKKFQLYGMKLFLIDGHALVFKMYYAFLRRPMINSKGVDTSILFGFTRYLLELIEREKPTHLAVSFDPPGGTFRNELYPQYKANRPETPQLIIDALEPLTVICRAMNIPVLMMKGFEADDVIGTAAKRAASEGYEVYMVTPDKDYGQLVEEHIFQYKPGKNGGENEILGMEQICSRYGIGNPERVVDFLTLCGDAADNVPGVNGIGEVGAAKLLGRYGSLDGIYEHLDELSASRQAQFEAARDHIGLSRTLVTIRTDVPLDVPTSAMALNMSYSPELADIFEQYEFRSLKRHISHISSTSVKSGSASRGILPKVARIPADRMALAVRSSGFCAIACETSGNGIFAKVGTVALASVWEGECVTCAGGVEEFRGILEDAVITKFGCDLKYQMNVFAAAGVKLIGRMMDIGLMHYLIDPEKSHGLDALAGAYLGISLDEGSEETPASLFDDDAVLEVSDRTDALCRRLAVTLEVGQKVLEDMREKDLAHLYDTMEEPLLKVLSSMERNGVKVDPAPLRDFAATLRAEIAEKEAFVRRESGMPEINLSSPKQVGEMIFEKMRLDSKAKKNGRYGWSTDENTLLELSDRSPVVGAVLEYRAARKLLSSYVEPFPAYVSPVTGRVHTTFNQFLTATGRLSSSNPNLQNIPVRTEKGKEIRKAFIPGEPGWWIMSADYSQIELRIMAHLSCDNHLVNAFRHGQDVHSATASKIFGVPVEEVTGEQRRMAKTANFGIMYGISAFGLAQRLKIARSEAKKLIDDYFGSFPAISSYIESALASARENGYVETLFGRRRYIGDINSRNATLRALAERNAVNAPIQGTAADIIKMAMAGVDRSMKENGLQSRMILQIHDELLFEVPEDELEVLRGIVIGEMENVISLSVPLTVECNYGHNWLEAH